MTIAARTGLRRDLSSQSRRFLTQKWANAALQGYTMGLGEIAQGYHDYSNSL